VDRFFKPLPAKSAILAQLCEVLETAKASDWIQYYNFHALPVADSVVMKDPVLRQLRAKRAFRGGVLALPANTCYKWHTDTDRRAAVNMLIYDNGNSRCLFAPGEFDVVTSFVELKYAPATYYAFNTQELHTVLNFEAPRFVFSLEFVDKDHGLTYDALCSDLEGLDYVS
jgi:hypothetical protein